MTINDDLFYLLLSTDPILEDDMTEEEGEEEE